MELTWGRLAMRRRRGLGAATVRACALAALVVGAGEARAQSDSAEPRDPSAVLLGGETFAFEGAPVRDVTTVIRDSDYTRFIDASRPPLNPSPVNLPVLGLHPVQVEEVIFDDTGYWYQQTRTLPYGDVVISGNALLVDVTDPSMRGMLDNIDRTLSQSLGQLPTIDHPFLAEGGGEDEVSTSLTASFLVGPVHYTVEIVCTEGGGGVDCTSPATMDDVLNDIRLLAIGR